MYRTGAHLRDTRMHRGRTTWGDWEKVAIYKSRREVSAETKPAGSLILISSLQTVRKYISVSQTAQHVALYHSSPRELIQVVRPNLGLF